MGELKTVWLPKVLQAAGLCHSVSEAARLIKGCAVRVNGVLVSDEQAKIEIPGEYHLAVNKRGTWRELEPTEEGFRISHELGPTDGGSRWSTKLHIGNLLR